MVEAGAAQASADLEASCTWQNVIGKDRKEGKGNLTGHQTTGSSETERDLAGGQRV